MRKNTLTTIDQLQPGDRFCNENGDIEFIKIEKEPIRKNKELFQCFAVPIDSITPKPFAPRATVIFLQHEKSKIINPK